MCSEGGRSEGRGGEGSGGGKGGSEASEGSGEIKECDLLARSKRGISRKRVFLSTPTLISLPLSSPQPEVYFCFSPAHFFCIVLQMWHSTFIYASHYPPFPLSLILHSFFLPLISKLHIEGAKFRALLTAGAEEREVALEEQRRTLESRHEDDLRRLKATHLKELSAQERSIGSEHALRDLSDEFHHSVVVIMINGRRKRIKIMEIFVCSMENRDTFVLFFSFFLTTCAITVLFCQPMLFMIRWVRWK